MEVADQLTVFYDSLSVLTPIYAVLLLALIWHPDFRGSIATKLVHADGYGMVKVPAAVTSPADRFESWWKLISLLTVIIVIALNLVLFLLRDFIQVHGLEWWSHWSGVIRIANGLVVGTLWTELARLTIKHFRENRPGEETDGRENDGAENQP